MKVTENTVANSLSAWLPFDQLFCKYENIGGRDTPHDRSRHIAVIEMLHINIEREKNVLFILYLYRVHAVDDIHFFIRNLAQGLVLKVS